MVVWLLDEKGADVNGTAEDGKIALHYLNPIDILTALLDRGANPAVADFDGVLPLMLRAARGSVDGMARLLQDPRARATLNEQKGHGNIALHYAISGEAEGSVRKMNLLLQCGGDPTLTNNKGQTPLDLVRHHSPNHHAAIALFEHALAEAEKASFLVNARRLAVAANGTTVAPSCLQARVA